MNIVLVSEALLTGGAETFVLRLASALAARGDSVSLFVLRPDLVDHVLARRLAPRVALCTARVPAITWVRRLDGLFFQFGLDFSLLRSLQTISLRRHLRAVPVGIVHSHLFPADLVTAAACAQEHLPWVTTMHGDYIALEARGTSRAARIRDFRRALQQVESSVAHIVAITDHQRAQLQRLLHSPARERISKIYNGYPSAGAVTALPPARLQPIPSDAFVIGMVARGIEEKGWGVLLAAFARLRISHAWLVLVGDGDYLREARARNANPRILFIGNVTDPLPYIARFDVGCLPTRFPAESLPTVVIEYLVCGKPVVATDIGEIARMLEVGTPGVAGILVPQATVAEMTASVAAALERLHADPAERARLQANARKAGAKFDMQACVDQYAGIYADAAA